MKGEYEYVVWYQHGDDDENRKYEHVDADHWQDAEDQVYALSDDINIIAVYQRAMTDRDD